MLSINNNINKPNLFQDFGNWLKLTSKSVVKKSSRLYGQHYKNIPFGVYDDDDDDFPTPYQLPKKTLDAIYGYYNDYDDINNSWEDDEEEYETPITPEQLKYLTEKYGGTCTDPSPKKRGKRGSKNKNKQKNILEGNNKKSKNKPKSAIDDMKDGFDHLSEDRSIFFYPNLSDQTEYETFSNIWELDSYLQDIGVDLPTSELKKICNSFESHCCINPNSLKLGITQLAVEESYGHLRWEYDPNITQYEDYDFPSEYSPSQSSNTDDLPF